MGNLPGEACDKIRDYHVRLNFNSTKNLQMDLSLYLKFFHELEWYRKQDKRVAHRYFVRDATVLFCLPLEERNLYRYLLNRSSYLGDIVFKDELEALKKSPPDVKTRVSVLPSNPIFMLRKVLTNFAILNWYAIPFNDAIDEWCYLIQVIFLCIWFIISVTSVPLIALNIAIPRLYQKVTGSENVFATEYTFRKV